MFLLKPFISWLKRHVWAARSFFSSSYHFTEDWFVGFHDDHLDLLLERYKGKPNVRYLEIGVFEGRSMIWMLENILTHPTARATGVDLRHRPWAVTARSNLRKSGLQHKVDMRWGRSEDVLRELPKAHFDIIYVDGDHDARAVMIDAIHAWHVLKPGGILIFDDYKMLTDFPGELRPEMAVDAFVEAFQSELHVLLKHYQVIVQKKMRPSVRLHGESQIGDHVYNWYSQKLYRVHFHQRYLRRHVKLSEEKRRSLEMLLKD